MANDDERGAQSIGRALSLLEEIARHDAPRPLAQLARATELPPPTAHRILAALEQRELVLRDPVSGEYSLGPTVLYLARAALRQGADGDLASTAVGHLRALREVTGETVGLHVVRQDRRLCIAELASHQPIRIASGIGAIHPLGVGAVGKVLLAHSSADVLDRVLALEDFARSSRLGTTRAAVRRALATVAADGFATSHGETVPGASAIAVPVLDAWGEVRGAINVTGPEDRWTEARMHGHLEAIRAAATWLERRLGRADGSAAPAG